MERIESARAQIVEERRRINLKVENERRKENEIEKDESVLITPKKIYLLGERKGKAHNINQIRRQLLGL